jgi:parallel beta-helix repeat protein
MGRRKPHKRHNVRKKNNLIFLIVACFILILLLAILFSSNKSFSLNSAAVLEGVQFVASTNVSSCSDLVTAGVTYTLNTSITGNQSTDICMNISADNIILDCQGYSITGTDQRNDKIPLSTGIYSNATKNITIKNCIVTNYTEGLSWENVNASSIVNSMFNSNNYSGVVIISSFDGILTNNTASYNNVYYGIAIYDGSNNFTLTNNTVIISSDYSGFNLGANNSRLISDSVDSNVVGVGSGFGIWGANISVENSTVSHTTAADGGIDLNGFNNSVSGCTFYHDTYSIVVNNCTNCTATNNYVSDNNVSFFSIDSPGTIVRNLTIFNSPYEKNTTISFTCSDMQVEQNWDGMLPNGPSSGYVPLGDFIQLVARNESIDWIFLNISYNDNEVPGFGESTLRIWKWDGGYDNETPPNEIWTQNLNRTGTTLVSDVNTDANYVYTNITNFTDMFAVAPLAQAAEVYDCSDLTSPVVYVLKSDLAGNQSNGACINMQNDSVTLDCQGHSIIGNESGTTYGVNANGKTHLSLVNCEVSNYTYGAYFSNVSTSNITNMISTNNQMGIFLNASNNSILRNDSADNAIWDAYSISSANNTVYNLTTKDTTSSFVYSGDIGIKSASAPAGDPGNYSSIGHYLNVTNLSDSWVYLNISYSANDVANVQPSTLRMWKYSNGSWSQDLNTTDPLASGVDVYANYVYANISNFGSIFAPIGEKRTVTPGGGGGGGGAGGAGIGETFSFTETTTNSQTFSLSVGDNIAFEFGGEKHSITYSGTFVSNNNSIEIEVASPFKFILSVGQTKAVDINEDGVNDLEIKLAKLENRVATLEVRRLLPSGLPTETKPQVVCGNGICEQSETTETCPADCVALEKVSASKVNYSFYMALIALITVVSIVAITRRHAAGMHAEAYAIPVPAKQQLLGYVQRQLGKGVSPQEIKQKVLAVGWDENTVKEIFTSLRL